jgi:hypothetical protein
VYDKCGWHAMPYLTQGDFYSEFGSYDVTITLPANYVVGATGLLQDPGEAAFLDERSRQPLGAHGTKDSNAFPPSSSEWKTIRYVQDKVHDFAWFADKRFIVRKGSVKLLRSGKEVTTWAMFTPKNALVWSDAVDYVNESVRFYSEHVGEYPYDACTAIDGTISAGGGMEYPMITIIGNTGDHEGLDNVIAHEVGHNWFYGILGSNERDHSWMDEGMNSFLELRYMRERYPKGGLNFKLPGLGKLTDGITDGHRFQNEMGYRLNARRNLDQPLSLTGDAFTGTNYGTCVYMKTALIMDHLMAYLGEETTDKCLHAYFEEWKFKHPGPEDLRKLFERESGKDLEWVFGQALGTDQKVEVHPFRLKDSSLFYSTNSLAPVPISGWSGTDSLGTIWSDASDIKWRVRSMRKTRPVIEEKSARKDPCARPANGTGSIELPWPNVDRIRIDAGNRTLDIDRRNNTVRAHGLVRRWSKPRLEPFAGLERNDRRSLYYLPVPAWNDHDGWQAGLVLRNTTFPSQRTEWVLAPLYALGSERFVGSGRIEHHFDRLRSSVFQNIHAGLSARSSSTLHEPERAAWYAKVSPSVLFDLKRRPLTRPWFHQVGLRSVHVENTLKATTEGSAILSLRQRTDYVELFHRMSDDRKLRPASISTTLIGTPDWMRAAIEVKQAFAYNAAAKQVRFRAFAGSFLVKNEAPSALQTWSLTWGAEDMLYDQAYLGRGVQQGFVSRQFSKQQGAFKTPFLQGGSDSWIASVNMEVDFPFKLPLAAFASVGLAPYNEVTVDSKTTRTAAYAEAGIGVPIVRDVIEVWLPLWVSQRIADEEKFRGREIGDRIRFVLALEKLDPTRLVRAIRP